MANHPEKGDISYSRITDNRFNKEKSSGEFFKICWASGRAELVGTKMEINSHSAEESPGVGRWVDPDLRAKCDTESPRVLLRTEKEDGNATVSKPAKGEERRKREKGKREAPI